MAEALPKGRVGARGEGLALRAETQCSQVEHSSGGCRLPGVCLTSLLSSHGTLR